MAVRPEIFRTVRNKLEKAAGSMGIKTPSLIGMVNRFDGRLGIFLNAVFNEREISDRLLYLLTRRYVTYSMSEDMVPFLTPADKKKKSVVIPIFLISSDHFGTSFLVFEIKDDGLVLVSPEIKQVITEDEAGKILRRRLASMSRLTEI